MANTTLQSHKISPFPCAVIIHIRFGGYHLSQSAKGIGTPNSNTKILLLIQNAKFKMQNFLKLSLLSLLTSSLGYHSEMVRDRSSFEK